MSRGVTQINENYKRSFGQSATAKRQVPMRPFRSNSKGRQKFFINLMRKQQGQEKVKPDLPPKVSRYNSFQTNELYYGPNNIIQLIEEIRKEQKEKYGHTSAYKNLLINGLINGSTVEKVKKLTNGHTKNELVNIAVKLEIPNKFSRLSKNSWREEIENPKVNKQWLSYYIAKNGGNKGFNAAQKSGSESAAFNALRNTLKKEYNYLQVLKKAKAPKQPRKGEYQRRKSRFGEIAEYEQYLEELTNRLRDRFVFQL